MPGWRGIPSKQRREFRRRNHIARDLRTPKYGPRIKEPKKKHLIEELTETELDEELDSYELGKDMGLASKE